MTEEITDPIADARWKLTSITLQIGDALRGGWRGVLGTNALEALSDIERDLRRAEAERAEERNRSRVNSEAHNLVHAYHAQALLDMTRERDATLQTAFEERDRAWLNQTGGSVFLDSPEKTALDQLKGRLEAVRSKLLHPTTQMSVFLKHNLLDLLAGK